MTNTLHRINAMFAKCGSVVFGLLLFSFASLHFPANAKPIPPIHVIGDSHSMEFNEVPHCLVHWLGPHTMHRVGRDGLSFVNLLKFGVQENEVAIFAFGEIDARCHIGKQRDLSNCTQDEIIENLVHHYLYTILLNKLLYRNLTCIIYSVTPPTNIVYNPAYPYYGTIEDRLAITQQLNKRLAEVSSQVGIGFLDVYKDYANPDGTLIYGLSDGDVHIHPSHAGAIHQRLMELLKTL